MNSNLPQLETFSMTSDDVDDVHAISPKSVDNNVPNNIGIHLDIAGYGQFNVMDGACIEILMLMVDSYKRGVLQDCLVLSTELVM